MTGTIVDRQEHIVRIFSGFQDWMDRYDYLIELGASLGPMDESFRIDENAISGCQSSVWITAELKDGLVYYQADSDAQITRGLLALLLSVLNFPPPGTIVDADLSFIDRTGLIEHLSPSRANGFTSMVTRLKQLAEELSS